MSKGIKMKTPTGIIKFPKVEVVQAPDPKTGELTTVKKYSIALVMDPEQPGVKEFLTEVDTAVKESRFPKTKPVYKEDKDRDEDTGEWTKPNGKIIMNFRSNYPIKYFDAKGKDLGNISVGFGSVAKIAFELCEVQQYKCLTKYVKGIQVLELKEGGTTAASCGFGEEEGYTMPEGKDPWDTEEEK